MALQALVRAAHGTAREIRVSTTIETCPGPEPATAAARRQSVLPDRTRAPFDREGAGRSSWRPAGTATDDRVAAPLPGSSGTEFRAHATGVRRGPVSVILCPLGGSRRLLHHTVPLQSTQRRSARRSFIRTLWWPGTSCFRPMNWLASRTTAPRIPGSRSFPRAWHGCALPGLAGRPCRPGHPPQRSRGATLDLSASISGPILVQ